MPFIKKPPACIKDAWNSARCSIDGMEMKQTQYESDNTEICNYIKDKTR